MPPKAKATKDEDDVQKGSTTKADSSKTKNIPREQEDPQPGPSTSTDSPKTLCLKADKPPPSKSAIVKSPVIEITSDEIFERGVEDDPVVFEVKRLQEAKEPFEKILMFHLDQKRFTDDQRKSWLLTINNKRRERSMSNIPAECETEASKEVAHLKFTEEEISSFCERLDKEDYWGTEKSKEMSNPEAETSSDSEVEMKESEMKPPHPAPRRSPRNQPSSPSWKEFKKGKNIESAYFKGQIDHLGVKKVIKKIVKLIWRKKKQHYIEKNKSCSIEVAKHEVQNLLFEAVGFVEKRYLRQIKAAALAIYPSDDDNFESDCESGSRDSREDWFPNRETLGSKINKMSVSVPTSTLKEYGLLDILIATLPMTLNYNDPAETLEFVEILKRARNRVPEHISLKNIPTVSKTEKEKHISGSTIICTAHVEPPPDLERLKRTGAKDYLKQIPSPDDEESETKSITDGVKDNLQLESKESESKSSMQLDSTEIPEDLKSIDESSMKADSTEISEDLKCIEESTMPLDSTDISEDLKCIEESTMPLDSTDISEDIKFIEESSMQFDSSEVSEDLKFIEESSTQSTEISEDIKLIGESSIQLDPTKVFEDMKFIDESSTEDTEGMASLKASEQLKRSLSPESSNTTSKKKASEQ